MALVSLVLNMCFAMFLTSLASGQSVEELNRRYDDFFHHRRENERYDEQRQKHAIEVKKQREREEQLREQARKDYIRTKPKFEVDPKLEAQWLQEQKAYKQNQEIHRKQLVQKKHTTEELLKRGRKIPELKEHDLDGY